MSASARPEDRPTTARPSRISAFSTAKLKAAREAKGWTQARLAIELDRVAKTVISWESGARTPEPPHLRDLATALGIKVEDLLDLPRAEWTLVDLRISAGLQQKAAVAASKLSSERFRAIETGVNQLTDDVAEELARIYQSTPEEVRSCWTRSRDRMKQGDPQPTTT